MSICLSRQARLWFINISQPTGLAKLEVAGGSRFPCLSWLELGCRVLGGSVVKNLPARQERLVRSLGLEDPLEDGRETHSIILAWRIPMDRRAWQAMGSQRVRHN